MKKFASSNRLDREFRFTFVSLSVFILVFPFLLSCAANLYKKYPVPISDYGELIEKIDRSIDQIATDRRVFDFHFRRGIYSTKGEGVFLYQNPDRMRIDLYVATAELVFQYYRNGDRSFVLFPGEGRMVKSENGVILLTGIEGLDGMSVKDDELKAVMLGLYDIRSKSEWLTKVREGKDGYLLSLTRGDEYFYLQVDPANLALMRYGAFRSGEKLREIRYSSYREVDTFERPWSVTYEDNENGFEIELSIRNEVINGEIVPGLFDPPVTGR